jgi:ubiquinone/menaquinone biosynthesis C-methylase UbiE
LENKYKQDIARFYDKHWESWNDVYEGHYDSTANTTFEVPHRRSIILRLMDEYAGNKTLRIIDVGCGTGVLLKHILEHGHYAVGVDISEKMVEVAREATSGLFPGKSTCLQGDIESLPFKSGAFDGVICAGVLSHQTSNRNSVSEIGRIAKKGGFVVVTLPNIIRLKNLLDLYYYYFILFSRLIGRIFSSRQKSKPGITKLVMDNQFIIQKYYYGQLNNLFRVNGLTVRETVSCGFGPFTFWEKEIFPSDWSMKLSGFLEKLASIKLFCFLKILANSWVICLEKTR